MKILNKANVYWITGSILGWLIASLVIPYNKIAMNLMTVQNLISQLPYIIAFGLIVGSITGIGQWINLKNRLRVSSSWIWITCIGYFISFVFGLVVNVTILVIAFNFRGINLLSQNSSFFFSPFPSLLIFGGFWVGIFQWTNLKNHLGNKARYGTLWVLGTWLGISVGVFMGVLSGLYLDGVTYWLISQSIIGMFSGLFTLIILEILIKAEQ